MTSQHPFNAIRLNGESTMRGVTLAVPWELVRLLLPAGLELGSQNLTPAGTHPVLLFFNDMFRLEMSIPTMVPSLTYHEHHVGIPFTFLANGLNCVGTSGPYYFMPKLHLDNLLPVLGGIAFWGFAKELTYITVRAHDYTVTSLTGQRLATLEWDTINDAYRSVIDFPLFAPIQQILSQPIISMVPFSVGPFFSLSDMQRRWDLATLAPMRASLQVDAAYVAGYPSGRSPEVGWLPSIIDTSLGCYVLRVPWWLSLPYPPPIAGMWR